jgi:hypothetical protein
VAYRPFKQRNRIRDRCTAHVEDAGEFRCLLTVAGEWQLLADIVAKVENRTTPKFSRKLSLRQFYSCNGL